ncbi:MAG: hypothetical protein QOE93_1976 [Actinomycetota bacterium]|nr:hypothetical protein [Actinomycetota bacterium]
MFVGVKGGRCDQAPPERGEAIGDGSPHVDQELTDKELIDIYESTVSGVRDGSIPTFDDRSALRQDVAERLAR